MPINDEVIHLTVEQMWLIIIVLGLWVVLISVTMLAVLRAATLPPPIALVVAMTVLTLVSIAAYVLTRADQLSTLAGMGMGALAGAVAALWQRPRDSNISPEEDTLTYTVGTEGTEPYLAPPKEPFVGPTSPEPTERPKASS